MKTTYFNLIFIFSISSCNFTTEKSYTEKANTIIAKIKHKKNTTGSDTLWVSQNDTAVFRKEEL